MGDGKRNKTPFYSSCQSDPKRELCQLCIFKNGQSCVNLTIRMHKLFIFVFYVAIFAVYVSHTFFFTFHDVPVFICTRQRSAFHTLAKDISLNRGTTHFTLLPIMNIPARPPLKLTQLRPPGVYVCVYVCK